MRRVCRWFARLLALVAALLAAGTLVPRPLLRGAAGGDQPTHHILVLASRIHTDIAVPIDLVRAGDFDFACLIPGHYESGMKGRISVTHGNH